jgi:2-oxoisovalerate dehydrogenase E2 component (dihydrolipoyl transacylase)
MTKLKWGLVGGGEGSQIGSAHRFGAGLDGEFAFVAGALDHRPEAAREYDLAAEIRRVAESARTNKSPREELTGSTITITSLGKLGGIASTPMINMPEVSIIGINKAIERAVVVDGQITVRLMMNLSSSFDHRFVDGFDAASMIQALKDALEQPATIFID